MSGIEHQKLRAAQTALRTATEALLNCLTHEQQHQVVQHLRNEANNLQSAYSETSNSWIQKSVQQEVEALRQLACKLEEYHMATMHLEPQPSEPHEVPPVP